MVVVCEGQELSLLAAAQTRFGLWRHTGSLKPDLSLGYRFRAYRDQSVSGTKRRVWRSDTWMIETCSITDGNCGSCCSGFGVEERLGPGVPGREELGLNL